MENHLQSVKYKRGEYFQVLDQLKVPHELVYRDIKSVEDAVDAIKRMQVRGAPLIGLYFIPIYLNLYIGILHTFCIVYII